MEINVNLLLLKLVNFVLYNKSFKCKDLVRNLKKFKTSCKKSSLHMTMHVNCNACTYACMTLHTPSYTFFLPDTFYKS